MYKLPASREKTNRRRKRKKSATSEDRSMRIIPQREGGLPLQETQMKTLRREIGRQPWLDVVMEAMKAVGNDTRVRILYLLWRHGEIRVNDLAEILGLTTPAISQQLKKLREASLVRSRRDAQTVYYRVNAESEFVHCIATFFVQEEA